MIDCWVAKCVAESEVISSSSFMAVPLTPVFNTGEVKVLFVRVSVDIRDTNVELPPVGNVNTSDALAECGCACNV